MTAIGQTTCCDSDGVGTTCPTYDAAFFGQDAQTAEGAAMSYADNGHIQSASARIS